MVSEEEGTSPDGKLVDLLTVELYLAVLGDFHSGHTLEKVLEHRVCAYLERGGVKFHRVFFYHYRIADIGDNCGLQIVLVDGKLYGAHLNYPVPEILLLDERPVAEHFYVEDIIAVRYFLKFDLSFGV